MSPHKLNSIFSLSPTLLSLYFYLFIYLFYYFTVQSPTGITFDRAGNLYVIELGAIVRVQADSSLVTTIAGSPGIFGLYGEDVPATLATFSLETTDYDSSVAFPTNTGAYGTGSVTSVTDTIATPKG